MPAVSSPGLGLCPQGDREVKAAGGAVVTSALPVASAPGGYGGRPGLCRKSGGETRALWDHAVA